MLKIGKSLSEVNANCLFKSGLEYAVPCRGVWNIVHTGFLVPESLLIFVCARSCLRGVVLTAAEVNLMDRFATVCIDENDIYSGELYDKMFSSVCDIVEKRKIKPRAVLLYFSCVHCFIGFDIQKFMGKIQNEFSDIDFIDCYMTPTMRKTKNTPDQLMRIKLYGLLKPKVKNKKLVCILGNDLKTSKESDIKKVIEMLGLKLYEIQNATNYDEYLDMASASLFITNYKSANVGADILAKRLNTKTIYMCPTFDTNEIENALNTLITNLKENCDINKEIYTKVNNINDLFDIAKLKSNIENEYNELKKIVGDRKIAIDYTITPHYMSLAKALLVHGFNVKTIFTDSISGDDLDDFNYVKEHYKNIDIYPVVSANSLYSKYDFAPDEYLAIGQKAAYFTRTNYFVNVVEGDGMYGFGAIQEIINLIKEAHMNKKNMVELVGIKGYNF